MGNVYPAMGFDYATYLMLITWDPLSLEPFPALSWGSPHGSAVPIPMGSSREGRIVWCVEVVQHCLGMGVSRATDYPWVPSWDCGTFPCAGPCHQSEQQPALRFHSCH